MKSKLTLTGDKSYWCGICNADLTQDFEEAIDKAVSEREKEIVKSIHINYVDCYTYEDPNYIEEIIKGKK